MSSYTKTVEFKLEDRNALLELKGNLEDVLGERIDFRYLDEDQDEGLDIVNYAGIKNQLELILREELESDDVVEKILDSLDDVTGNHSEDYVLK